MLDREADALRAHRPGGCDQANAIAGTQRERTPRRWQCPHRPARLTGGRDARSQPRAAIRGRISRVVLAPRARAVVSRHLSLLLLACAAPAAAHPAQSLLDSLASAPAFAAARIAALAVDITSGDTLAVWKPDDRLPPASTAKLAITATALERLGREARLHTELFLTGAARGGVWHGDVVVRGGGDPNLSGRFAATPTALFAAMAESLRAAGITTVDGDVIGDASAWADDGPGPSWQPADLGEWFGALPSALSFNDNCVDVRVAPGARRGDPALLTADIPGGVVRLHNAMVTGDSAAVYRGDVIRWPGSRDATLRGVIAAGSAPRTLSASVPDPALFAASALAATLESHGIAIRGHARAQHAPTQLGVARRWSWDSRRLCDLVAVINTRSQNLHAELLLRALDTSSPRPSRAGGLAATRAFLAAAGVDTAVVTLDDACGLGRANRATPRAWVQLLHSIDAHPAWAESFWSSLPLAGRDSWLRRLAGTAAQGRIRAKTGTLDGVHTLAGRAETAAHRTILFAFFSDRAPDAAAQAAALRFASLLATTP